MDLWKCRSNWKYHLSKDYCKRCKRNFWEKLKKLIFKMFLPLFTAFVYKMISGGNTSRPTGGIAPQVARGLLMDGTGVESAFALLLTKVTKSPYPAINIFCAIIGRNTNLCALSGANFRKKGEAYDDEMNNVWYGWAGLTGSQ